MYCFIPIWIPFEMALDHYQAHFSSLINLHKFTDFDDFKTNWPGNMCNINDVEEEGFDIALYDHFNLK